MLLQIAAALALLAGLWMIFRFAMGLRWAKVQREQALREEERHGRRLVAELPQGETVALFLADAQGFHWSGRSVGRGEIRGARLLLNGGVMAGAARAGSTLPEALPPEEHEGRERWEVVLYLDGGRLETVACGTLREGVSREAANRVFAAVRAALEESS
jgi:hypothetical protein